ncbi:MAG TPA: hypothetical protein VFR79_12425 [Nitrospira sp.]|nr:hypothetical protein [Nitrospira sp.]
MKQASMTTLGIALLLGLTSPSYSSPDNNGTEVKGAVHWVNPNGSKGIAVMSAASNRTLTWTNPDGTQGIVERHSGPAPAFEYAWANPDGYGSASMKAFNGVNHGSANLTTNRTDVAQDNAQQFHEVTKGDGPMSRLPLLGMLVAGVTLWVVRQVSPG